MFTVCIAIIVFYLVNYVDIGQRSVMRRIYRKWRGGQSVYERQAKKLARKDRVNFARYRKLDEKRKEAKNININIRAEMVKNMSIGEPLHLSCY